MMSRLLTRREQLVLLFVGSAVIMGSVILLAFRDQPGPAGTPAPPAESVEPIPSEQTRNSATSPAEAPAPEKVIVAIRGAVDAPGVYTLRSGSRVYDLIAQAGGLDESADTSNLNLAARLIDGTTLSVQASAKQKREDGMIVLQKNPAEPVYNPPEYTLNGWDASMAAGESRLGANNPSVYRAGAASGPHDGRIDLNRASTREFESLPGIGPVLAGAIVAYREEQPFREVNDLQNVSGIGPKRLEAVRNLVTVAP